MNCNTFDEFVAKMHIIKEPNDKCWLWTGGRLKRGYGHVQVRIPGNFLKVRYRCTVAHRYAFELFYHCRLASNLQVRHTCDNIICVNPHHMLLGSNMDNVKDKVERNRQFCKVSRTERNEIIELYNKGNHTQKDIAAKFNISREAVSQITLKKGCYAS